MINLNDIDTYLLNNNANNDIDYPNWEKLGFSLAKDLKNGSRLLDLVFNCERQKAKTLYIDNVYIFTMINRLYDLCDLSFSKIFKDIYNNSFPIIPNIYVKSIYEKIEADMYNDCKENNTKCIQYLIEIQIAIYLGILSVFLLNKDIDKDNDIFKIFFDNYQLYPFLNNKPEIIDNKIDIIPDEESIRRALWILDMDAK